MTATPHIHTFRVCALRYFQHTICIQCSFLTFVFNAWPINGPTSLARDTKSALSGDRPSVCDL